MQIKYKGNNEWDLKSFEGIFEHPVHLDVSSLNTFWTWYNINNEGYIDINYEMIKEDEEIPKNWKPKYIHWTNFDENTRIGWRGPIMLWEKLFDLPMVHYDPTNI